MRDRGFTIAELLIGMAVGLLVLLAVTTVYISVLRGSSGTVNASRLNQEMAAIMNIMANDIRRAGYWEAAASAFNQPAANPFIQVEGVGTDTVNISALRIHSNGGSGTTYQDVTYDSNEMVTVTDNAFNHGSCITYTYDANRNGDYGQDPTTGEWIATGLDNDNTPATTDDDNDDEEFGFRWDGWPGRDAYSSSSKQGKLLMRSSNNDTGPNSCGDNSGRWEAVNDFQYDTDYKRFKSGIIITNLDFSIKGSSCLNASEPDGVDDDGDGVDADKLLDPDEFNCYKVAPKKGATPGDGSGHSTVEVLTVQITLEAELADDPQVKARLVQSVTPRNNLIRMR